MISNSNPSASLNEGLFPPTAWSMVMGAGNEAMVALERLATAYWRPLYVFTRQRGESHESAADAVQGFFVKLLSGDLLRKARPGEGRFRNYLLVAYRRWMSDERDKAHAAKRGGGAVAIPLDELEALQAEPMAAGDSPEAAFDRKWAESLVSRALVVLEQDWAEKAALFSALRCGLEDAADGEKYADIGARLGMSAGAVGIAAFNLRKEFSAQVRREIRATVATDAEVEPELRHLVALLRG